MDKPEVYPIKGPADENLQIPFHYQEGEYLKGNIKEYYEQEGYAVIRNAIPKALCDTIIEAFRREVKPYPGFIYRQASANPEKHVFTEDEFMLNSILNLQSLDSTKFNTFREASMDLLSHSGLHETLADLFGTKAQLVQSMFFEGNPATWAHQDTYYLDSEQIGSMCGVWFALEDIHPGAGRFYIYPGSQKINVEKNGGDFEIAFHHDRYKNLVKEIIRDKKLECKAPPLNKGDILIWNSKTIHGSLAVTQPEVSRMSITGHYIPDSHGFLQFQKIPKPLALREYKGVQMHMAKDLNNWKNKIIFAVETNFPQFFQSLKRYLISKKLKS
ncbi:MAG: phytanoyl-CoA hydroxylase [Luteibaculaceae bacterium]|jgi:phytanoyl-CoA hydroxylase